MASNRQASSSSATAVLGALMVFGALSAVELVSNLVAMAVPAWAALFEPASTTLFSTGRCSCEVGLNTLHPSKELAVLSVLVSVVTLLLAILWLTGVCRRVDSSRAPSEARLESHGGLVVGAFLLPLFNLVAPYFIVKELWRKLAPVAADASGSLGLVRLWAIAWAATWVLGPGEASSTVFEDQALAAACSLALAVLSVMVVRIIEGRMTRRQAAYASASHSTPA